MKLCLVIPCYNEADRLHFSAYNDFLKNQNIHLLFVDDGSTDATYSLLVKYTAKHKTKTTLIHLNKNTGKAQAIRIGALAAGHTQCDVLGFWDADLAIPLSDSLKMLSLFKQDKQILCIFGARVRMLGSVIQKNWLRHFIGRSFAIMAARLLNIPFYDPQCGAKLFHKNIATTIFTSPFQTTWLFDIELICRLKKVLQTQFQTSVIETPVSRCTDIPGSKIKIGDYFISLIDFIKLSQSMRYYSPKNKHLK